MNKVLTILLALFLFSCKQDQSCYKCTTTITITITESEETNSWSVSDERSNCDLTESKIREYEIANTDSVTYINGQVRIDTVTVTTCKK
jgi:ABC-type metal ion transport system substrate-binding protein